MLAELKLENFRNFESSRLPLDSKSVCFVGPNGQGKSSLLEAIFFLSTLRSFRTTQLKELKMIGKPSFKVEASILSKGGWTSRLEAEGGIARRLKIDGAPVSKASSFAGKFNAIAFLPDDPEIISGPSSTRRRFVDMFISMVSLDYFNSLQTYFSALKSRNFMLKEGRYDNAVFASYDSILAASGAKIVSERAVFIQRLSDSMEKLMKEVRPEVSKFEIKYKHGLEASSMEGFLSRVKASLERDRQRGFTGYGPHLDDFDFVLDDKVLRMYGSRGQCRVASLCLKMAEFDLVSSCGGGRGGAVVLIDDATGDLDASSKGMFLSKVSTAGQVFHTFTEMPERQRLPDARIFKVSAGTVKEME